MSFETPTNNNENLKDKVMEMKKKLEEQGMKVFIDEEKLDNPEALNRVADAFSEIKNAYRVTISGADGEVLVDIEKSKEDIDASEEKTE